MSGARSTSPTAGRESTPSACRSWYSPSSRANGGSPITARRRPPVLRDAVKSPGGARGSGGGALRAGHTCATGSGGPPISGRSLGRHSRESVGCPLRRQTLNFEAGAGEHVTGRLGVVGSTVGEDSVHHRRALDRAPAELLGLELDQPAGAVAPEARDAAGHLRVKQPVQAVVAKLRGELLTRAMRRQPRDSQAAYECHRSATRAEAAGDRLGEAAGAQVLEPVDRHPARDSAQEAGAGDALRGRPECAR